MTKYTVETKFTKQAIPDKRDFENLLDAVEFQMNMKEHSFVRWTTLTKYKYVQGADAGLEYWQVEEDF